MVLRPVSVMTKAEIMEELTNRQVQGWEPSQTLVELRAILSVLRKIETPESTLKGLTTMRLNQLRAKFREVFGTEPAETLTRGLLITELRNHLMGTIPPKEADEEEWLAAETTATSSAPTSVADIVAAASMLSTKEGKGLDVPAQVPGPTTRTKSWLTRTGKTPEEEMRYDTQELRMVRFGKHQGKSYELMMIEFPSYCDWVLETNRQEPEASDALKHFANYLLMMGFGGRKWHMTIPAEGEKPSEQMTTTTRGSSSQPVEKDDH